MSAGRRWRGLLAGVLLLAALQPAGHAQPPEDGAPGTSAAQDAATPAPPPAAAPAPAPEPEKAAPERDDRFLPSEEISEDLSVSFPADI